jgi:hypothetical protein
VRPLGWSLNDSALPPSTHTRRREISPGGPTRGFSFEGGRITKFFERERAAVSDGKRRRHRPPNLSSAIRVYVLEHYIAQVPRSRRSAKQMHRVKRGRPPNRAAHHS